MRRFLLFLLICSLLLLTTGCQKSNREYLDDIIISLEDDSGELIIREWRFLHGSGAEVYYRCNEKTTLLGRCSGADDGYCPFRAGLYRISQDGRNVTVRWYFDTVNNEQIWREKVFQLPF